MLYTRSKAKQDVYPLRYCYSNKEIIFTGIALVVMTVSLLIWKNIQITSIKEEYLACEKNIREETYYKLEENNKQFLKSIAKPYVWAIKAQLMRQNLDQIDLYGNTIVNAEDIVSVMVVDQKGTIISTTDQEREGRYFISFHSPYYLNVDSTVVYKATERLLTMASPIMNGNNKMGTLVINYSTGNIEQL